MLIEGKVGPQGQSLGDGAPAIARLGRTAEIIMQELHGRYFEQANRGAIFLAANQAVVTTTVGLATTYTGLVVSNPINSPVVLSLLKASMMQSVIQATQPEAFALAFGNSPSVQVVHTTPATVQPSRIGSGAIGLAKADVAATLPVAPLYGKFAGNTATATQNGIGGVIDLEGSVILLPGSYACWVTPGQASVAGMWFSMMWEEVPL